MPYMMLEDIKNKYKDIYYPSVENRWDVVNALMEDLAFFKTFIARTKALKQFEYKVIPIKNYFWNNLPSLGYYTHDRERLYEFLAIYDIGESLCVKIINWTPTTDNIKEFLSFQETFKSYMGRELTSLFSVLCDCASMHDEIEKRIDEVKKSLL